jgi:MFS family permease
LAHELDAFRLVVLLGAVSLFTDMAGDGYYSIVGPYLGTLGASASIVAIVVGLGGLVAYTPRLASGWYCDHTGHYWNIIAAGLVINLLAVPLLALAGHWEMAFGLIIFERVGKALRAPARDAILSHAAKGVGGMGRAFGLHEAMSDIGSMVGPIMVALVLQARMGYTTALAVLIVPALLALAILVLTVRWYPHPMEMEACHCGKSPVKSRLPRLFWLYLLAAGLLAAAFVDFPLISYHMSAADHLPDFWIPLLFATAMGMDALSALIFGRFYDRVGMRALVVVFTLSALFVPLVFGTDPLLMVAGIVLWGVGQGAIESILRGAVGELVPMDRRGAGYGIYSTSYGILWFAGNVCTGLLYMISVPLMILVSVAIQLIAVGLFIYINRQIKHRPGPVAVETPRPGEIPGKGVAAGPPS